MKNYQKNYQWLDAIEPAGHHPKVTVHAAVKSCGACLALYCRIYSRQLIRPGSSITAEVYR